MIDSIRLQHFRSYEDASFEFDNGVNIVIGPNGSGKTNLLEAILVLSSGKSYRAKDADLVSFNTEWARLDGFFGSSSRTVRFKKPSENDSQGRKPEKDFLLDDKTFKRLSLDRTIPVVLFEPDHLQLASRGPDFRRDFFDDILEHTQVGYKALLGRYIRTLAQRNALLKQAPTHAKNQIFAWDVRLSELGAQIAIARGELTENINKAITRNYNKITGKRSSVMLEYGAHFDVNNYSSQMMSKLERMADTDFERGFTAYGPHREDFTLYLKKQPAQTSASRGEIRSLLISLKIFELGLIEKARAQKPIFLLDDVFSELDGARRRHLVDYLSNYQTIITTTDADAVVEYFSKNTRLISLS